MLKTIDSGEVVQGGAQMSANTGKRFADILATPSLMPKGVEHNAGTDNQQMAAWRTYL